MSVLPGVRDFDLVLAHHVFPVGHFRPGSQEPENTRWDPGLGQERRPNRGPDSTGTSLWDRGISVLMDPGLWSGGSTLVRLPEFYR